MDIGSKANYPANALSNFAAHSFTLDGVECASMEGVLQAFKFKNPDIQREVCRMVGLAAKRRGGLHNWKEEQTLYWQGIAYPRRSEAYQALLKKAFTALTEQSASYRSALKAARGAVFTHSMGKNKEFDTVLTEREFCRLVTEMRDRVISEMSESGDIG